jgi:iron complex transport system substrate-binding protein
MIARTSSMPPRPPAAARLALLALVLWGCPRDPAPGQGAGGIRLTDDRGRQVWLARPARRIASLSPANSEILFALGCGRSVVLRDLASAYPPQVRKLPATNPFQLSAEHVAGFKPDLVLLSHADPSRLAALRRLGLTVAVWEPRTFEDLYGNIQAVGRLCGAADRARALVRRMQARVAGVQRRVRGRPRPRVYIETDGSDPLKPWTCSAASFVGNLLRLAGGRNLVQGIRRRYVQINAEEVLTGDPDVILMMDVDGRIRGRGLAILRARPGWGALRAVRRGRIIDHINSDLLSRPGPRLVDGLEALARALHPEVY